MNKSGLPKQTVAQAFVLWRVPIHMPISKEMLMENIAQDIEDSAEEHDFHFSDYSRRATPERTLKFLLERNLLTKLNTPKGEFIKRNDRTVRYIARLPEKVVALVDTLPICDPLTLMAGAARKEDK